MAERIKLNKVSLRMQKQQMAMYKRFLPALEARKQQLLMNLVKVRKELEERQAKIKDIMQEISSWSDLLGDMEPLVKYFIEIKEIKSSIRNVAGLKVSEFQGISFTDPPYSYFLTPPTFEEVVGKLREAIEYREAIIMLKEAEKALYDGFRKTSQRINLYEQRLIPDCREAIRRITVYLQDQQAAAVGVAKVAKRLKDKAMLQDSSG